jgi:hypothetical protein
MTTAKAMAAAAAMSPAEATATATKTTATATATEAAAPAIPAVAAAPTIATPEGVTAPIPAGTMPAVIVKAVISAAEEELRLFDRGSLNGAKSAARNSVHYGGIR